MTGPSELVEVAFNAGFFVGLVIGVAATYCVAVFVRVMRDE